MGTTPFSRSTPLELRSRSKAAITLNIAPDECSGVAALDHPYGTIPVPRSSNPAQVVNWLLSEVGDLLKKPSRTARHYVRLARLKYATINDMDTLDGLLEMELESIDANRSLAKLNPEIKSAARAYDDSVERVLTDWAKDNLDKLNLEKGPLKGCTDASDVVECYPSSEGELGISTLWKRRGLGLVLGMGIGILASRMRKPSRSCPGL